MIERLHAQTRKNSETLFYNILATSKKMTLITFKLGTNKCCLDHFYCLRKHWENRRKNLTSTINLLFNYSIWNDWCLLIKLSCWYYPIEGKAFHAVYFNSFSNVPKFERIMRKKFGHFPIKNRTLQFLSLILRSTCIG
jgi:hypothetical protein